MRRLRRIMELRHPHPSHLPLRKRVVTMDGRRERTAEPKNGKGWIPRQSREDFSRGPFHLKPGYGGASWNEHVEFVLHRLATVSRETVEAAGSSHRECSWPESGHGADHLVECFDLNIERRAPIGHRRARLGNNVSRGTLGRLGCSIGYCFHGKHTGERTAVARVFHVKHWHECEKLGCPLSFVSRETFSAESTDDKAFVQLETSKWDEQLWEIIA